MVMLLGVVPLAMAESVPLPYVNECETKDGLAFTKNGTRNWTTTTVLGYGNSLRVQRVNTTKGIDASVFFPEMDFVAGKYYAVIVTSHVFAATEDSYVDVQMATGVTHADFIRQIGKAALVGNKPAEYTFYFRAEENQTCRVAVHGIASAAAYYFYVDRLEVREVPTNVPVAPEATVTPYPEGAKKASVSMTAPTESVFGGSLASGDMKQLVATVGGNVIHTVDNPEPGKTYTFDYIAPVAAGYSFNFYATVDGCNGQNTVKVINIGAALPDWQYVYATNQYFYLKYRAYFDPDEESVTLELDDLEKEKIAEGSTYTVVRKPDNVIIAAEAATPDVTDMSFPADKAISYYYELTVHDPSGSSSMYTNSTVVSLNNPVPYVADFTNVEQYKEYCSYDIDKDATSWNQNSGFVDVRAHDDMLITSGLLLEAGKVYKLTYSLAGGSNTTLGFQVWGGSANTLEAMTEVVVPYETYTTTDIVPRVVFFSPKKTGNYFLGFHAYNPNDMDTYSDLRFYNFSVTEAPGNTPTPVTALQATYPSTTKAVISFCAPKVDVSGADLESLSRITVSLDGAVVKAIDNPEPGHTYTEEVDIESGVGYDYTVVAYGEAGQSLPAQIKVVLVTPPYTDAMTGANALDNYTIEDVGGDGFSWHIQNKAVRVYPHNDVFDDWLFTPNIYLEGGKYYKVHYVAHGEKNSIYKDNYITMYVGHEASSSDMGQVVIPESNIYTKDGVLLKDYFSVRESGVYHLGWHATSKENNGDAFYVGDFSIGAPRSAYVPGAGVLVVSPGRNGALECTVEAQLPVKDIAGDDLEYPVTRVVIYVDGMQMFDLDPRAEGYSPISHIKEIPEGAHLFTMICHNEAGEGREYDIPAYIGINRPYVPTNYVASRTAIDGEVKFTWEPPVQDYDGFPIYSDLITYNLVEISYDENNKAVETPIVEGLSSETFSYTYACISPQAAQQFKLFGIRAVTKAGASPCLTSPYLAVGKPDATPYTESFKNARPSHAFRQERIDGIAMWSYLSSNSQLQPLDNDYGYAFMEGAFSYCSAGLVSGRIQLPAEKPVISFYVYNFREGDRVDINYVGLQIRADNDTYGYTPWEIIADKYLDDWTQSLPGWHKLTFDLSKYAGQVIEYAITGQTMSTPFVLVDKIYVGNAITDMAAISTGAPAEAFVGRDIKFSSIIKNLSTEAVSGYKVSLLRNNEEIATATPEGELEGNDVITVPFTDRIPLSDFQSNPEAKYTYKVRVTIEGDGDAINNVSDPQTPDLADVASYPTVANLSGADERGTIHLSWDAPDVPAVAMEITDDAEAYANGSNIKSGIGRYSLYDGDNFTLYREYDLNVPLPVSRNSKESFFVIDFSGPEWDDIMSLEGAKDVFAAHSGSKAFISMGTSDTSGDYPVNDWLISPELSGEAQTLSFFAKGRFNNVTEYFAVYVSSTGNNWTCFKVLNYYGGNNNDYYKECRVDLPEGTKYFAIVHYYGCMLFVDDITYTPAGNERLTVEGYNVYREGKIMESGFVPVAAVAATEAVNAAAISFYDASPELRQHNYDVTVLYNRGESMPESVLVALSGLGNAASDAASACAIGEIGAIRVTGAEGMPVVVYSVDGKQTAAFTGASESVVPAPAGIYVVTIGADTFKVAVR